MFTIENLHKKYGAADTENEVLRGLSFEIADGESIAITGASGSGKSTLLNLLATLDTATSGKIEYNGTVFSTLSASQRRSIRLQEFGFVFQAFHLISTLSVHENIILSAVAKRQKYDQNFYDSVIEQCGLQTKLRSFPHQLSGGEQQRVAVARALLSKPNVIFADEPTGNLDSKNAEAIFSLLHMYASTSHATFIYVTHEQSFTRFADRHIHLKDGMICTE